MPQLSEIVGVKVILASKEPDSKFSIIELSNSEIVGFSLSATVIF